MDLKTFVKKGRETTVKRLSVEEIGPVGEDRYIDVIMKLSAADFWSVFYEAHAFSTCSSFKSGLS